MFGHFTINAREKREMKTKMMKKENNKDKSRDKQKRT